MEPFLGQIALMSFGFPPRGWALCRGQLLMINQNQALFSLLGTTYGGDGRVTFALPDLRERIPVGAGQGPGLPPVSLGESGGLSAVTLLPSEIPAHSHPVAVGPLGSADDPVGNFPAKTPGHTSYAPTDGSALAATAVATAGGSQPHDNEMPYLGTNFVIALQGIFPSRD